MKIDRKKIEYLKYKLRFHNEERLYFIEQCQYDKADMCGKIIETHEEELKLLEKQMDEIYSFWTNNFFKYYKITFKNCCGFPNEIYMYPYEYIESNELLRCVINYNDDYKSGLSDSFIHISYFFDYDYECEEISKEQFVEVTCKNVENPLTSRLDKLKNRDKLIE